jgi:hypothetical protein
VYSTSERIEGVDEGRRGAIEDRAIRRRGGEERHRLGAAAAAGVLDHEVDPHDRPEMLDHLAQEHVRAAAGTGVRDERDGVVRIVDLGARSLARRERQAGKQAGQRHQQLRGTHSRYLPEDADPKDQPISRVRAP